MNDLARAQAFLAHILHVTPAESDRMTLDELALWTDQARAFARAYGRG